jgi:parallel beta-helix repeat protein
MMVNRGTGFDKLPAPPRYVPLDQGSLVRPAGRHVAFDKEFPLPRRAAFLSTLAALAIFTVPAFAQTGTSPGSLELYPNPHAIGVRLTYTGDDDNDATARIEWRNVGAGTWIPGVDMTRITNRRWAGSVLWLVPDLPVEVRVVVADPDGGGGAVSGTTRTAKGALPSPTGRTWWVAITGNDANAGTEAAPLRTIGAAVSRAQAGEEVRVKPGRYYETIDTPRGGTATQPIHLVSHGPGVVLDGSDPNYLSRGDWQNESGGVYSVPFTGTTRLVCADSLQRLYRQATLTDLRNNANGISQGWVVESGRLYVKLEDGSSPTGHVMHVARYDNGIYLDAAYWRISGLEVRYYGTTSAAAGIYLRGSSNCVISDNHVHTIGGKGIYMRALAANNVIERNLVRDPRIGGWPWTATKAHEEEQQGISNRGGRGNVIRSNTITGTFDGVDVAGGELDENVGADTDIHENLVTNTADDAFEPESSSGINIRMWRNRADNVFNGISIAPSFQGPTYILFNLFTNYRRGAYKFSISSTGHTLIAHNTSWSSVPGTACLHPTGPYSNVHFRNNIMVGHNTAAVSDDAGESQSGNDFDGDLVHSGTASTLFRWKGVNYTSLTALRTATGFEANGRSGDPLFAAAAAGDFTLLTGSPAIDGAVRIAGINDAFSGRGPDVGAWELGTLDLTPPATITDLRSSP